MDQLVQSIDATIAPYGFRPHWRTRMSSLGVCGFWRRCTFNTNRAVVLVSASGVQEPLATYCQVQKWKLLRCTRFVPLFYEVGLQLIVVDHPSLHTLDDAGELAQAVDLSSNQLVVLQSVFLVDQLSRHFAWANTRGQLITVEYQLAIERAIKAAGFTCSAISRHT